MWQRLSGDDMRARFYTGLAARAGADVGPIRRAFSRPAKGAIRGRRVETP
jgi:hypothetical protein